MAGRDRGRAVDAGRPVLVVSISPTSYSLLQRCPRSWWYQYVARRPRVSTFALDNGSAVHAAVEHYLDHGTWPEGDAPALVQARRGAAVLDAWKATAGLASGDGWAVVEANAKRDLVPFGGVDALKGRVDWHGESDELGPWVVDHKTTANNAFWKSPEQLAEDPQLLAYAGALFAHAPGNGSVTVAHMYIPPPPLEPTLVSSVAPRSAIDAVLADMARATVEMATIRTATDPEAVEARTSGCWAFGGCPHADVCSAAPESLRRRHHPTETTNTTNGAPMALTEGQMIMRAKMRGITVEALRAEMGLGAPASAPTEPKIDAFRELVANPPPITVLTPAEAAAVRAEFPVLSSASVLPPDAPVTPLEADRSFPDNDLEDVRLVAEALDRTPAPQKLARAKLCARLGIPRVQASRWTRIVAAGLTAGLWTVDGDGLLVPSGATAPNRAPTTTPPESVDVRKVTIAEAAAGRAVLETENVDTVLAEAGVTYQHRGRTIAPEDVRDVLSAVGAANAGTSGSHGTSVSAAFLDEARKLAEMNVTRALMNADDPTIILGHLDVLARICAARVRS